MTAGRQPRRESLCERENSTRRRTAAALPAFLFEPLFERGNHDRGQIFPSQMRDLHSKQMRPRILDI